MIESNRKSTTVGGRGGGLSEEVSLTLTHERASVTSMDCDRLSLSSEQSPSCQATSRHLASPRVRSAKVWRACSGLPGSVGPCRDSYPGNEHAKHGSGQSLTYLLISSSQQPSEV